MITVAMLIIILATIADTTPRWIVWALIALIGLETTKFLAAEAMEYGQCQWDMMTDAMQERYRQNPHGYHRLGMGTIWTDDDMDDDYLTDAVLAQDFGTELHDWTK